MINLTTNAAIATIPVGKKPVGVAINSQTNRAVVTNKKDNTL